jgi:hypothetical protein
MPNINRIRGVPEILHYTRKKKSTIFRRYDGINQERTADAKGPNPYPSSNGTVLSSEIGTGIKCHKGNQ